MKTIGIICGGPGPERAISLKSARSICLYAPFSDYKYHIMYIDKNHSFYLISESQLLCETPENFDFNINTMGPQLSYPQLIQEIKNMDIVFPIIHGLFGEDGHLNRVLESNNDNFIGSPSTTGEILYFKDKLFRHLRSLNIDAIETFIMQYNTPVDEIQAAWHRLVALSTSKRCVIKPTIGGSSIDIHSTSSPRQALEIIRELKCRHESLIMQPHISSIELTVSIIEIDGIITVLPISELEKKPHSKELIFSYKCKYNDSDDYAIHTPPRLSQSAINAITAYVKMLFKRLNIHDFARFDGWWDGEKFICNDINLTPGLSQQSFFFKQSNMDRGFHHTISAMVNQKKLHKDLPPATLADFSSKDKKPVFILISDQSSIADKSPLSGFNVWQNLKNTKSYFPIVFFVDAQQMIYQLPYQICTIDYSIGFDSLLENIDTLKVNAPIKDILPNNILETDLQKFTISSWLKHAQKSSAFIFNALHPYFAHYEKIIPALKQHNLPSFNLNFEPNQPPLQPFILQDSSNLDTYLQTHLFTPPFLVLSIETLQSLQFDYNFVEAQWLSYTKTLKTDKIFITPVFTDHNDPTSATTLTSYIELRQYAKSLDRLPQLTSHKNKKNNTSYSSNLKHLKKVILCPHIDLDAFTFDRHDRLHRKHEHPWVAIKAPVIETNKQYTTLPLSLCIEQHPISTPSGKVLGGLNANITPISFDTLSRNSQEHITHFVQKCAETLSVKNHVFFSLLYNTASDEIFIWHINTCPQLNPLNPILQQAHHHSPKLFSPASYFEFLITNSLTKDRSVIDSPLSQSDIVDRYDLYPH